MLRAQGIFHSNIIKILHLINQQQCKTVVIARFGSRFEPIIFQTTSGNHSTHLLLFSSPSESSPFLSSSSTLPSERPPSTEPSGTSPTKTGLSGRQGTLGWLNNFGNVINFDWLVHIWLFITLVPKVIYNLISWFNKVKSKRFNQ